MNTMYAGMEISSSQGSIFWESKTPSSPVYSSAGSGPAGDQPGWGAGAALDLRGANEDRGPRRWNLAEIRHAFETPFVAAEQRLVGLELLARPDVQRDGVDADAGNVALRDQELAGLLGEAREVERVRLIRAQVGFGVADLHVPARIHEHAATPGQATMPLLPRLDVINGHGTVRVPLGAPADVDDRSWNDEVAHGKLFHGLALGDEVARRVDVRAVVVHEFPPVDGHTELLQGGDRGDLDRERQAGDGDDREFGGEGVRQVHDLAQADGTDRGFLVGLQGRRSQGRPGRQTGRDLEQFTPAQAGQCRLDYRWCTHDRLSFQKELSEGATRGRTNQISGR